MPGTENTSLKLKSISEILSIFTIIVGIIVLIGWAFNLKFLLSPSDSFSTIKSNVGVGFVLIGFSLWLLQDKRNNLRNRRIAQILAFIAFLIGFLTLFQDLSGINLGIDQILFKESTGAIYTANPNRMAPTAALSLILSGISLIFMDREVNGGYRPSQYLILIMASLCLLALVGYVYNANFLYYIANFTGIGIYAAFPFFIFVLGFILARPDQGFMRTFNSDLLGSSNVLRLLLPTFLIILILGWFWVQGRNFGLYQAPYALGLFAVSNMIIMFVLIWQNTVTLNHTDLERKKAYMELQESRDHLEDVVQERTKKLVKSNEDLQKEIIERRKIGKELDIKLKELERSNRELEQFAYIASHDLQEPLRMVSSYIQLIESRYADKLDQDAYEFIEFAVDGAERMQTMIQDLLIYSRITTKGKKFESINMNHVLEEVFKNLEVSIKETQAKINAEKLPQIKADPFQMVQLFQNLISNSIKFRGPENPVINISFHENSEKWVFSLEDNGIGIDPQYVHKIFDVFKRLHTRAEYPGTGIGLAICKKIVERHGGDIWVESELNKGSKFIFTISKNQEDFE